MTKLPQASGQDCIDALARAGFDLVSQKGSHVTMRRDKPYARVTVPRHKTLKPGTLRGIIRNAGFTVDEFVDLLNG